MSLQHPTRTRLVTAATRFGPGIAFGLVVMLLAGAATLLRQAGIPKVDTMWGEDARVFSTCAYDQAALDCILKPYEGYLHLVPRVGAELATLGAPEQLALRIGVLSAVIAGAATLVAARAVVQATRSYAAALIAALGILFAWLAAIEVGGNLTNVHWMLLAASAVVLVCGWLGRTPGIADMVLIACTTLSSALSPLLIPLAIVPVLQRRPRARVMLAVTALGAIVQAWVILTSHRSSVGRAPLGLFEIARGSVREMVVDGWFGPRHRFWNMAVVVLTGVVLAALAVVPRRSPRRDRALAFGAAATLVLFGFVVYWASIVLNRTTFSYRYGYEPAALVLAALAVGCGLLAARAAPGPAADGDEIEPSSGAMGRAPRVPWRTLLAWGLAGVLLLGVARTFRVEARASRGPDAAAQLAEGRGVCASTPGADRFHVLVSPNYRRRWFVDVPCDAYVGE